MWGYVWDLDPVQNQKQTGNIVVIISIHSHDLPTGNHKINVPQQWNLELRSLDRHIYQLDIAVDRPVLRLTWAVIHLLLLGLEQLCRNLEIVV